LGDTRQELRLHIGNIESKARVSAFLSCSTQVALAAKVRNPPILLKNYLLHLQISERGKSFTEIRYTQ
jgi:type IV pilus biogenesis protein CpaD/CtpE